MLFSKKQIAGQVANWAIQLSPYTFPDDLEVVVNKIMGSEEFHDAYEAFDTIQDLEKYLDEYLLTQPEVMAWNCRKNGNDAPFGFTSRYDPKTNPDNDFIDLHALKRNIAMSLWKEGVEFQDFNKQFEQKWKEHGERNYTIYE